jgi:hypothetical protein
VPLNRELPPLVTALTFMPPEPNSAAKLELSTLTSCTMSLLSVTITPLFDPMSIRLEPSAPLCWVPRMPLTV